MGYIGSDPKTKESVSTSQLIDDSVTNAKIVDDIQFNSVTSSVVSASSNIIADTFSGTFSGALSSSAQIGASISGSFTSPSASLSTRVTAVEAGSTSKTLVSSSVLSSPSQGTIRLATNGVNTDVDSGLQSSDSPTFAGVTVTGTLTAQEIHTEFESASILFTSGSTIFGNSIDDTHNMTGSLFVSGAIHLPDEAKINLGSSNDGNIKHSGTNLQIQETTGNIQLINYANDKDISLSTDDGSGGTTAYITLDGSTTKIEVAKDTNFAGNVSGSATSTGSFGSIVAAGTGVSSFTGGNVGIGTGSPDQQLHLYSTTSNSPNILIQNENDSAGEAGNAGGIEFYLKDDNGSNPDFQDLGIIRWTGHDKDNPYNKFTAAAITGSADDPGNSSGRIDFGVAYSDSMMNAMTIRAASSGVSRVGIGTNNPGAILDVDSGAIGESDSEACGIRVTLQRNGSAQGLTLRHEDASGGSTDASEGTSIQFQGYDGSNSYHNLAAIFGRADGESVSDSDSPGFLTFHTTPNGSDSFSERMRITSAGNVGIGTDSPQNESSGVLLHIADTGGSNAAHINLSGGDGGNDSQTGKISFSDPGDPDDAVAFISSNVIGTNANPGGNLNFFTAADGGSMTNRLTIRSDGTIFQGTGGSNLAKNSAHAFNVAAAYPWISNFAYNGYPAMQMYRSNNSTVGSHTATADSDIIGVMNWYGSTSSAHKLAASIDVRQSGSMGSYYTPSRMDFYAAYDDENFGVSQPVFSITGPGFENPRLMGVGTKVPTSKFHVENATNRSVRYVGLIKNYGDASGGPINIIKCNVPRDANGLGYSIVFNLNVTAQVGQGANHASIRTSNVSVALARAGANSGGDGTDTASSVVVDTSAYSEVGSAGSSGGLTISTSNSGATSGTQTVYIRAAISGDGGTGAYILVSGWASGHDDITFSSA